MSAGWTIAITILHVVAALGFAGLAALRASRGVADTATRTFIIAASATAAGALATALIGPASPAAAIGENLAGLAWIGFILTLWRSGGERLGRGVAILYIVLTLTIAADSAIALTTAGSVIGPAPLYVVTTLRIVVAVGALMLLHNFLVAADPQARARLRGMFVALAALWSFDISFHALAYIDGTWPAELIAMRGIVLCAMVALLSRLAGARDGTALQLANAGDFRSFALVAIAGYLAVLLAIVGSLSMVVDDISRVAQAVMTIAIGLIAAALGLSKRLRGAVQARLARHFLDHRYDYRAEWVRFTETLGNPGAETITLNARIVKAIADITGSPGGLLLLADDTGQLIAEAQWQWPLDERPRIAAERALSEALQTSGETIDIEAARAGTVGGSGGSRYGDHPADRLPQWMLGEPQIWALVPLIHFGHLEGAVLLIRPPQARSLDWEDRDLLRVVGGQAASYLAEARGQQALSEALRFEEFNRRFAFIMHDIKNQVSQLGLLARNAERHAGNPEFHADMVATLGGSVERMNDLLARLSQHNKAKPDSPRKLPVMPVVERVAAAKRVFHAVVTMGPADLHAVFDPVRLEQALDHLVQNAIDASDPSEPVCVFVRDDDEEVVIDVIDRGIGMAADFIRDELFRPFHSTKAGGFGIGAHEARALVRAMGGDIDVASRPGDGSEFSLRLPARLPAMELPDLPASKANAA